MLVGKLAVVCGYGNVGKGSASTCAARVPRDGHRDRPDLRPAGGDGGLSSDDDGRGRPAQGDIFVTATGNIDVITIDHMRHMKDRAIVCNIGHFDSEIQIEALRNYPWEEVKPQVDEVVFPDGNG